MTDVADSWALRGLRTPKTEISAVRDIIARAEELLSWKSLPGAETVVDFSSANAALSTVSELTNRALQGDFRCADKLISNESLIELLVNTKTLENRLHRKELRYRASAFGKTQEALARLHGIDSVSSLLERAAESVPLLSFDRCAIGRIDHGSWVVESYFIENDPGWATELSKLWLQKPPKLGAGLIETDIVRRKSSLLVSNAQDNPLCRNSVVTPNKSRSYVAAPIMPQGNVIGFVHTDGYGRRKHVDEFDQDVLSMFTEGLGYALQRTMLLERLESLRLQVAEFTSGITSAVDEHIDDAMRDAGNTFGFVGAAHRSPAKSILGRHDERINSLTKRERDVLQLMASGETNARIATRLFISDGTVKSHAKSILRKLGASNRAEAVARFLASQH